jgi:hypothetical protein
MLLHTHNNNKRRRRSGSTAAAREAKLYERMEAGLASSPSHVYEYEYEYDCQDDGCRAVGGPRDEGETSLLATLEGRVSRLEHLMSAGESLVSIIASAPAALHQLTVTLMASTHLGERVQACVSDMLQAWYANRNFQDQYTS